MQFVTPKLSMPNIPNQTYASEKAYYCRVVKHQKMARSNECAQTVVPILKFLSMKKPSAKNLSPKLHQVSEKALMPTKNLLLSCGQALKDCEIK